MVGVVYLAPEPGADAFVTVGKSVKAGDTVALVEAMKTFNPIKLVRNVQGDPLTHTYDVFLELKNPNLQLLPGMVVSVSMPIGSETDTNNITVPIQAVQQNADNTHFVWLKKNNKAQRQTVQIGQTQGNRIVISSGLKEKDEVIIEGYQKVSEDSNIK